MTTRPDGHVSWRRLLDRRDGRDGRLTSVRAAAASAHLAEGCAACAGEADAIERLVAAIAEGPPDEPPRRAVDSAIRVYRESCAAFLRDEGEVLGVLILDSIGEFAEPAASLRADASEVRRILWRVGEYEVDASVVGRPGGADLLGQMVPGGDDPAANVTGEVSVRGGRGVRARTKIESDGRFTLRGLLPGVYTIEGRADAMRFVLPPVYLG